MKTKNIQPKNILKKESFKKSEKSNFDTTILSLGVKFNNYILDKNKL